MILLTAPRCHFTSWSSYFTRLLYSCIILSALLFFITIGSVSSFATDLTEDTGVTAPKVVPFSDPKAPALNKPLSVDDLKLQAKKDKILIESTPYLPLKKAIDPLIVKLSKETRVSEFSIYAKDLKSNTVYTWNAERLASTKTFGHTEAYYKGASVAKLYEVFAVYKLAEAGYIDLDQKLKDPYTGYEFTLRAAIGKAIRKSDNDSFCRILRAVGPGNINKVLTEYGIKNNYIYAELGPAMGFSVKNNAIRYKTEKSSRVNPYGAGIILEYVFKESAKNNAHMMEFKNHLLNNVYTSRIPAALSYKIPVAHKTGTIESEGVYHDAGIVYGTHPYIIVVYTKDAPDKNKAHVFMRGAIRSIHKALSKNRNQMDLAYQNKVKAASKKKNTPVEPSIVESSSESDSTDEPSTQPLTPQTVDPSTESDSGPVDESAGDISNSPSQPYTPVP